MPTLRSMEEPLTPIAYQGLFITRTGDWRWQRPVMDEKRCRKCGQCWLFCPTNSRYESEKCFDTNLDYCKGCGVCAFECMADAITMVPEERFKEEGK
ncbi:MAG: 4Fe-4S binding protein [Chloroflexota bacterium]